jgi:putative tryptophan/tyrosine transport system substrate-binding protein
MKHPTGRLSVILALGILVAPLAADAQFPKKLFRLGYILPGSPGAYTTSLRGLRQGLRDFGYLEGQNLVIEERYAEGQMERLPEIFTELLGLKVDILVAPGTAIARAAQQATTSIPIVAIMGDPIGTGLAASLAHPDGNVTGISTLSGEGFSGKWLELLKEIMPHVSRVAYLWNPTNPVSASNVKMLQRIAPALNLNVQSMQVANPKEFERVFATITSEGAEALILEAEPLLVSYRSQIVQFAAQHRLPVIAQHRAFVEADGLMSYGPNFFELWRRIGSYVDRIFKGAKPGDLPIEQAMSFELVINLKAAKALGLTIPPTLLFQADEVIK